jgi:hypothetical protein
MEIAAPSMVRLAPGVPSGALAAVPPGLVIDTIPWLFKVRLAAAEVVDPVLVGVALSPMKGDWIVRSAVSVSSPPAPTA